MKFLFADQKSLEHEFYALPRAFNGLYARSLLGRDTFCPLVGMCPLARPLMSGCAWHICFHSFSRKKVYDHALKVKKKRGHEKGPKVVNVTDFSYYYSI